MRWAPSIAVTLTAALALAGCSLALSDGGDGDGDTDASTDTVSISLTSDVVNVVDTWLWEFAPGEPHGSDTILAWDLDYGEEPSEGPAVTLLRFDLGGDGGFALPDGATLVSATLFMTIVDNGDTARIALLRVPWDETTTWSTLGASPGLDAGEDFDPTLVGEVTAMAEGLRPGTVVTHWVSGWLDGSVENNGWVISAVGSNGVEVYSSDAEFAELRPELVLEFAE